MDREQLDQALDQALMQAGQVPEAQDAQGAPKGTGSPRPRAKPDAGEAALRAQVLYASPVVSRSEPDRRPKPATVCERCPSSLWFNSANELKCYCRRMYLVTWSRETSASPILDCDGPTLGMGASEL